MVFSECTDSAKHQQELLDEFVLKAHVKMRHQSLQAVSQLLRLPTGLCVRMHHGISRTQPEHSVNCTSDVNIMTPLLITVI